MRNDANFGILVALCIAVGFLIGQSLLLADHLDAICAAVACEAEP